MRPRILMIGNNSALAYLIERYAHQEGYDLIIQTVLPQASQIRALQPAAILFASPDELEIAQPLLAEMTGGDIPILVCISSAEKTRARELGADSCLAHPLTHEEFCLALASVGLLPKPPGV